MDQHNNSAQQSPIRIFVDADGCPVKHEVYKVAQRYRAKVFVVANMGINVPKADWIEMTVVKGDFNAADDWIAETVAEDDIVVTADIPLAERCLAKGAEVLGHRGNRFDSESIGHKMATRSLMEILRQTGEATGGPRPFSKQDRSRFLSALDQVMVAIEKRRRRTRSSNIPSSE